MTIAAMNGVCPYCKRTDPLKYLIEDGKKIAKLESEVAELREALEESAKMLRMDRPINPLEIIEQALARARLGVGVKRETVQKKQGRMWG